MKILPRWLDKGLAIVLFIWSFQLHSNPVELALTIGGNLLLFQSASYTEKLIDDEDQKEYQQLAAEQRSIRDSFLQFQSQLASKLQNAISLQTKSFSTSLQELAKKREYSEKLLSSEIKYLNQSINLDYPKQQYLVYPISYEQQFAASPMLTLQPWHNLMQGLSGDWAYEPTQNRFSQRIAVPFSSAAQGQQNSIFTEYFTNKDRYTIEIDLTIISASYPFFIGIAFNRPRWISGSLERAYNYRLIGLHGVGTGDKKQLNLCFAQGCQIHNNNLATPLDTIVGAKSSTILSSFDLSLLKSLEKEPLDLTVSITTSEQEINLILYRKKQTEKEQLFATTITPPESSQNSLIFRYHGIGLFAAGCIASFAIKEPQELSATTLQACASKAGSVS